MDSLKLGGNIELVNAGVLDRGALVIVKKLVGNYARRFSEKGMSRLEVSFGDAGVTVTAECQGREVSASAIHTNVFFSVDNALRDVEQKL